MSTDRTSTNRTSTNRTSTEGVPADPTAVEPAVAASRQCSRCRATFPVDDTLHFTAEYAWWLCPTCSSALLGKPSR
jgi:DNA-directed RNA polymerase subunit RPC12/RpoP